MVSNAALTIDEQAVERRAAGATPEPLRLVDVTKRYRRGAHLETALDGVNLFVEAGEFLALVGPSGAGKSTLLHIAGGLLTPDAGTALVSGQDVGRLNRAERARLRRETVGFVFQFFHLMPALTVSENIALPLLFGGRPRPSALARARDLLDQVGLSDHADALPGTLSGGQMQRVALARALVGEPMLILADEPTGNLDSRAGAAVLDLLITRVKETGAALVLVTHDPQAAAKADRKVTLRDGHLT